MPASMTDLTGTTRGKWTFLSGERTGNRTYWLARCECGNERRSLVANLNPGGCRRCLGSPGGRGRRRIDLMGKRYERLVVIEDLPGYPRRVRVRCDCGAERTVHSGNLQQGFTRSCGCLLDESRRRTKYGTPLVLIPEYHIWQGMLSRCSDPEQRAYKHYGGRGIFVCEGWRDFGVFFKDMGPRPNGYSIDRKDNDGGYWCGHCAQCVAFKLPANCRWATTTQQARNRRNNVWLTHNGKTMLATDWARALNVSRQRIDQRLRKYGPTDPRTFTKKGESIPWARKFTAFGLTLSLKSWAKRRKIKAATIYQRLARGVPIEQALLRELPAPPRVVRRRKNWVCLGTYRCRQCGGRGHNRRTCNEQIREAA